MAFSGVFFFFLSFFSSNYYTRRKASCSHLKQILLLKITVVATHDSHICLSDNFAVMSHRSLGCRTSNELFSFCICLFFSFFPLRLMSPENTLLQPREEEGVKYERTFMASEFLDWLVQEGEATTRKEAEQLCHRLMEYGIIQHGECMGQFLLWYQANLKSCGLPP